MYFFVLDATLNVCSDTPLPLRLTDEEHFYFLKLLLLIIKFGTRAMKSAFDEVCPPAMLSEVLSREEGAQCNRRDNREIWHHVFKKLYPRRGEYGRSENFDISVMYYVFSTMVMTENISAKEDIFSIKDYRNKFVHQEHTFVSKEDFETDWNILKEIIVKRCGENVRKEIDELFEANWSDQRAKEVESKEVEEDTKFLPLRLAVTALNYTSQLSFSSGTSFGKIIQKYGNETFAELFSTFGVCQISWI